jgi:hemolysin activation/secretion protein
MSLKSFLSLAAAGMLAVQLAHAQDRGQVAPKQPTPTEQGGAVSGVPAPPASPAPAESKQLLPSLKGLRLVGDLNALQRNGVDQPGLNIESLPLLDVPEARAKLEPFIGQPLASDDLPKISQVIIEWYRGHNRPVVDVNFPEQDITTGTLQVVVTEYKLGKVTFDGNRYFSSETLQREVQSKPGEPINLDRLKADLNMLNRNPFRSVNAVLERSDIPGNTDIGMKVQDRFPLRGYLSFDNNGLPIAGRDRWGVGLNWGNAFGLDQQISYQFTTSPDLWRTRNRGAGLSNDPRFMAHSLTWLVPLSWGDTLSGFASYAQQVPNLGPDFGQVGHNLQLSLRYQKTLPTLFGNLYQQVQFGFDHKRSDNNLAFGGTQVFNSATNVDQFLLVYGVTRPDSWGQVSLENTLAYSPGGFSPGNSTGAFLASGIASAEARYTYDTLQITRLTELLRGFTWLTRLTGQVADTELLPSEQLGAGGVESVRGYDPRAISGSQGFLISNELRSPALSPLKDAGLGVDDALQLLAFHDYGRVGYLNDQTNLSRRAELQSVGIGLRYSLDRYMDVRFDYGWQLERVPGASKLGNLGIVSITVGN